MSLIVEDGTGLTNANCYISLTDADTYHSDRGNSAWAAAAEADRNAAIIKATQWLDARYRAQWLGYKLTSTQALEWPRSGAVDRNGYTLTGVPARLPDAVAEAALAVVNGANLTPTLKRGGKIRRKTVGPITTEYFDGAPARDTVTAVGDLIRGYTTGTGIRITR